MAVHITKLKGVNLTFHLYLIFPELFTEGRNGLACLQTVGTSMTCISSVYQFSSKYINQSADQFCKALKHEIIKTRINNKNNNNRPGS
jgi:hypothetical protein